MTAKQIRVVPYDPQWPRNFEAIRKEIQEILGELAVAVHHVGSTSVPGMSAKPIIDLDVEIPNRFVFPEVCDLLAAAGYQHEGDLGIRDREAFRYEGKNHLQKHHLYVCPRDSRELHRHLTFRNYLRTHPEAAREYSRVKEAAARQHPDSIEGYMSFKNDCIAALYQKCGLY